MDLHRVPKSNHRATLLAVLVLAISTSPGTGREARRGHAVSMVGASRRAPPAVRVPSVQPLGAAAFPDFGSPFERTFQWPCRADGKSRPGKRFIHARSARFQGPGSSNRDYSECSAGASAAVW